MPAPTLKKLYPDRILERRPDYAEEEAGLRANTFTPWTPYLRAVFSFEVARKQSKRAVIRTSSSPI
jgi:hypothetical protein